MMQLLFPRPVIFPQFSCLLLAFSFVVPMAGTAAEGEAKDADKWNVSSPAFSAASRSIPINTSSGTWMSLDVSPDGSTIVFDLLGDIYTLALDGGEARNISAGFHWDMQPRFSPDGKKIAFTSDRAGGDNIWVMQLDGSAPVQLTEESFTLLNNPVWSPDGQYIAARKHFTTQRSLGTGEIWMYHLDGGDGVQIVERPNERFQKELGEPVYRPDGSALYYTQNVTSGDIFEYAQDTNTEVFAIREIDLQTGETRTVAGGPGGAVRPTPSPDGRHLAYVKRVRARSMLFLKDLATGTETLLTENLDQDMQEAWAVHGVYPNMAWTPDSKSIVFWAGGHLNRVRIEDRVVTNIPFEINDSRDVYDPPRFEVEVSPESFTTRMIRWAQQHDTAQPIVFESLGRLYIKRGGAEAIPLTRNSSDEFELFPRISPDQRWVYYVTWNDQELGSIRRVSIKGGSSRKLTLQPGHYREIDVSPDGETLVFRTASGGGLLDDRYGVNPGIFMMPASGGESTRVTGNGYAAHFGDRSDRLYLTRRDGSDRKLVSINLAGADARDVAKFSWANEVLVSPSGTHVAFVENYHVFVTPLPRSGGMIDFTMSKRPLPVVRVSKTGGQFLGWSGAGKTLSWSVGPQFKSVAIDSVTSRSFEQPASGVELGITTTSATPVGAVTLTNARIIPMDGEVIEQGYVVIARNRVEAVGSGQAPENGNPTLDLGGKTIVPGMIDIHAHGPYGQGGVIPQQNWSALGHLALGVTTVHDPSSRADLVFSAAEYARAGKILSPRTFSTGEIVYGAKASFWAKIDNLDNALAHARRLKSQGAIALKNYNQPRRSQRQQVVEAARQNELMVVAEGGSLYHMDLNLVADGNTGIEHSLPQLAIYDDVVQFWGQTQVGYTPTLVVGYGTISGEDYWYQHTEVWKHPLLSRYVPPGRLQARSVRRQMAPESDHMQSSNAAIGKQLADAGVSVHTGAHGQREGLGTHWEMWMLVQGGMSPLEALRAATIAPAQYLGLDGDIGSITAGKLADLVIIDGEVDTDIRLSDRITHVMLNGRLYEAETLKEVLTGDSTLNPFYWSDRPQSAFR